MSSAALPVSHPFVRSAGQKKTYTHEYFILASTPITRLINKHHQLRSSPAPCPFHVSVFGFNGGFFHTLGAVHSCQISETSDAFFSFPVSPPIPSFLISSFFCFFFLFFLYCFITNIVTGDQSPSSPGSRWPGANYGNRTLGVCI